MPDGVSTKGLGFGMEGAKRGKGGGVLSFVDAAAARLLPPGTAGIVAAFLMSRAAEGGFATSGCSTFFVSFTVEPSASSL